jgi:hypothetical protein
MASSAATVMRELCHSYRGSGSVQLSRPVGLDTGAFCTPPTPHASGVVAVKAALIMRAQVANIRLSGSPT